MAAAESMTAGLGYCVKEIPRWTAVSTGNLQANIGVVQSVLRFTLMHCIITSYVAEGRP